MGSLNSLFIKLFDDNMVTIKNGLEINAVFKGMQLTVVLTDESEETIDLMWADVDAKFLSDLKAFLIRKYKEN